MPMTPAPTTARERKPPHASDVVARHDRLTVGCDPGRRHRQFRRDEDRRRRDVARLPSEATRTRCGSTNDARRKDVHAVRVSCFEMIDASRDRTSSTRAAARRTWVDAVGCASCSRHWPPHSRRRATSPPRETSCSGSCRCRRTSRRESRAARSARRGVRAWRPARRHVVQPARSQCKRCHSRKNRSLVKNIRNERLSSTVTQS